MIMRLFRRSVILLAAVLPASPASAEPRALPAPAQVIYPGDKITDSMLVDMQDASLAGANVLWDRADLVGKVARRTLLPGRPIPTSAVEEARAVSVGALVSLVYRQDGLNIVTTAQALQNGYIGQLVQARNLDSGIVVTGIVQADGSIRVQGG